MNYLFKFADFSLNPRDKTFVYQDEPVYLSLRPFEILLLLVQKHGKLIEKEEFLEKVWPESFVEESNLAVQINALRKLLAEKSGINKFIETVSGRGYCFVYPVEEIEVFEPDEQTSARKLSEASLAVLPFTAENNNQEFQHLACSLTQTLIDDLSQNPKLKIKAYSAVKTYADSTLELPQIADLLGVGKILLGHFEESEDHLKISVELINASDQRHIWGRQYHCQPADLFEIGKKISRSIGEKLHPRPNNLAKDLPPLIGREKEAVEITDLLRKDDVRLLTLTGVGGTGKTRLAQAVAQEMLPVFSDGVFFVELAAITNSELVASTIAAALGVKEAGSKMIIDVLKGYLAKREMLLVIDNFEQVADGAWQLAEMLSATSQLKILVTSREILHLKAEREYAVPPLCVPTETQLTLLDEASKYEAIKLFVERGQGVKSNFALTEANVQSVTQVCGRLDGLPLAIELAAVQLRILSPSLILSKLENSLKLLAGGAKDLPARQQTMRGTIQWSYELLTEEEKQLFRRLSVFAGGFRLEAAEAVCTNHELQMTNEELNEGPIEVLKLIRSLVDKSLLISKEQKDDEQRFRMLEVVREYALEMLEASSEAERLKRNHTEYFLALGEEAEPHLQAAQAVKWFDRLEEEHNNLRAALRWSLERESEMAARLVGAIRGFWLLRNHLAEGSAWFKAALERNTGAAATIRFKLLNGLGMLARYQGDCEMARKVYEESLAEGRAANDLHQITMSSTGLGWVAYRQGDFTTARKFFEEGLTISCKLNYNSGIAVALNFLGELARTEGDNAAARHFYEEALVISRQLGSKQIISANLINLGATAYGKGDYKAARLHFAEALLIAQELGYQILISDSLDGFAALSVKSGEAERAARLAGATEQLRQSAGYEIAHAERRFREAYLTEIQAMLEKTDFTQAYEQGRQLKLEEAVALALEESEPRNEKG